MTDQPFTPPMTPDELAQLQHHAEQTVAAAPPAQKPIDIRPEADWERFEGAYPAIHRYLYEVEHRLGELEPRLGAVEEAMSKAAEIVEAVKHSGAAAGVLRMLGIEL